MDDQISRYEYLVRQQADVVRRSCISCVTRDDLVAAGLVGLWQALQRYDASRGIPFTAFARHRIRGEMLDSIRRMYPGYHANDRELFEYHSVAYLNTARISQRRLIEKELAALPPHWAKTIREWMCGESGAAMARREGVSQPTICIRRGRALAAMRRSLEARGVTLAACV